MGFIFHFYIIFGTNLLTGGPAQICCFMPISVFREKGISNRVETERNQLEKLFLEGKPPDGLEVHVREEGRCPRGWGRAPLLCGPPFGPPTYSFLLYITTYPQTIRYGAKNLIPPPQLSVSTRSHLGACSGAPPEEGHHHGGLLHHPSPSMKCE